MSNFTHAEYVPALKIPARAELFSAPAELEPPIDLRQEGRTRVP